MNLKQKIVSLSTAGVLLFTTIACTAAKAFEQYAGGTSTQTQNVQTISRNSLGNNDTNVDSDLPEEQGVSYRIPSFKVINNKDLNGDGLGDYTLFQNWITNYSSIDPLATTRDCPSGTGCDNNEVVQFYEVMPETDEVDVYVCGQGNCGPEDVSLLRTIKGAGLEAVVDAALGVDYNTVFVKGPEIEANLKGNYTLRDLSVFLSTLNPAYSVDYIESILPTLKELRGTPNKYCGDQSLANPILTLEFDATSGLEFPTTVPQYGAFLDYFEGGY